MAYLRHTVWGVNLPTFYVYDKLGHRRVSAINIPWSNRIGHVWRFVGITNDMSMACGDDIDLLNALESLDHRDISQEGYNQFERFIFKLYQVYTKVNDIR